MRDPTKQTARSRLLAGYDTFPARRSDVHVRRRTLHRLPDLAGREVPFMRTLLLSLLLVLVGVGQARAAEPLSVPGSIGAITVPFEMPDDGTVSIGLYNADGGLVRALLQCIELEAGAYETRWDGMDSFGNLVEAGTELTVRVISNPGLRAYYEFDAVQNSSPVWMTRPQGEGDEMRAGGWTGDHSAPSTVATVGNRVFVGSKLVEYGHGVIMLNEDGEKMWGRGGLAGWAGPRTMTSDGERILATTGPTIYRWSPTELDMDKVALNLNGDVRALAAHGDTVYTYTINRSRQKSPFRYASGGIDVTRVVPEVSRSGAPTDFHLSGVGAFRGILHGGGAGDIRHGMALTDAYAYVVLPFEGDEKRLGTIAFERQEGVARIDVAYLPAGTPYVFEEHQPDDMFPEELPFDWEAWGEVSFDDHRIQYLTAPDADFMVSAVMVRFWPDETLTGQNRPLSRVWKRPTTRFIRLHERRLQALTTVPELTLPEGIEVVTGNGRMTPETGPAIQWDFRSEKPITDVFDQRIVLDYGSEQTFRGMTALNLVNPKIEVEIYVGDGSGSIANAPDEDWQRVATWSSRRSKTMGTLSAIVTSHDRSVFFKHNVTTRAVRLRLVSGFPAGKDTTKWTKPDVFRSACADIRLLATMDVLADEDGDDRSQVLEVHTIVEGRRQRPEDVAVLVARGNITAMACAEDGTLYTLTDGRLCRTTITGKRVEHEIIDGEELRRPKAVAVRDGTIVVVDRDRGLVFYGTDGRFRHATDRVGAEPGAWDPDMLANPSNAGVSIDSQGRVWVAEGSMTGKRVGCFNPDGTNVHDFFGSPMYGGGGHLDPTRRFFYYRGFQWELDWEAGTSRMRAMLDRYLHPDTPTLDASSFVWTDVDRPLIHNGVRYLYGGGGGLVITILGDDDTKWKPAVVMGPGAGSRFLLRKPHWQEHWAAMDLNDTSFIWCDENDDGDYQIEEVQLVKHADYGFDSHPLWPSLAPDLTIWSSAYLEPHSFTPGGVPLYRWEDVRRVELPERPTYYRGMTLGGKGSAKPQVGTARVIARDHTRLREGQPFLERPDGTIVGFSTLPTNSNYQPGILGEIMKKPLRWVGRADADGDVTEVAVMNGDGGRWSVVSIHDGLLVGEFFTGREGGWGTDLLPVRGTDVTHRSHSHETFFGDFLRADDGKFYTIAGKGFHSICRIEGLNDYTTTETTITVPADSLAVNQELREYLRTRPATLGREQGPRQITVRRIEDRTRNFKLNGTLEDWGPVSQMPFIGPMNQEQHFSAAFDDRGIYLAYTGWSHLGNASEDPMFLFKKGFSFELKLRKDSNRSGTLRPGDQRIVFGPHQGEWIAMRYNYVDNSVLPENMIEFASPLVVTKIATVEQLTDDQVQIAFRDGLGVDITDLGATDAPAVPTSNPLLSDVMVPDHLRVDHGNREPWTAEVFVTWEALGFSGPPGQIRADVGILTADSGGVEVLERMQWSNIKTDHVSDVGVEARIAPRSWGVFRFAQ